jgi:trehalose synthase
VTEAMWKGKPVVGGSVGGIRLQIEDGINGYLVSHIMDAEKITNKLFKNPALRKKIGVSAKERVRQHFLLPRMLRDYLKIVSDLVRTDKLFV